MRVPGYTSWRAGRRRMKSASHNYTWGCIRTVVVLAFGAVQCFDLGEGEVGNKLSDVWICGVVWKLE